MGSLIVELFRPFCRWSCHYSSEGHRSPIADALSFCLRWRESTEFGSADGKYAFHDVLYSFLVFFSSLYFLIHSIRCRSSTFGAECCTSWSTCCWHKWLECRWIRGKSFLSSCAVKAHIQDEEGVGGKWSGSVFCHWGYRCSWQTEPFLLSDLP